MLAEKKLRNLQELLLRDPKGARRELQKHVEDLRVAPVPVAGERLVQISGRTRADGLLGEEAVRLQLVAGAGYAEYYTISERYWIDLK